MKKMKVACVCPRLRRKGAVPSRQGLLCIRPVEYQPALCIDNYGLARYVNALPIFGFCLLLLFGKIRFHKAGKPTSIN